MAGHIRLIPITPSHHWLQYGWTQQTPSSHTFPPLTTIWLDTADSLQPHLPTIDYNMAGHSRLPPATPSHHWLQYGWTQQTPSSPPSHHWLQYGWTQQTSSNHTFPPVTTIWLDTADSLQSHLPTIDHNMAGHGRLPPISRKMSVRLGFHKPKIMLFFHDSVSLNSWDISCQISWNKTDLFLMLCFWGNLSISRMGKKICTFYTKKELLFFTTSHDTIFQEAKCSYPTPYGDQCVMGCSLASPGCLSHHALSCWCWCDCQGQVVSGVRLVQLWTPEVQITHIFTLHSAVLQKCVTLCSLLRIS